MSLSEYIYLKMIIVLENEWLNRTSLNIFGTVEYEMHVVFFLLSSFRCVHAGHRVMTSLLPGKWINTDWHITWLMYYLLWSLYVNVGSFWCLEKHLSSSHTHATYTQPFKVKPFNYQMSIFQQLMIRLNSFFYLDNYFKENVFFIYNLLATMLTAMNVI